MKPKDKIIFVLATGLMCLLVLIVLFDFTIAIKVGRPPDDGVIELLKMSITGLVGVIAGYLAGREKK